MANILTRPLDLLIVTVFISFALIAVTIDYTQALYGSILAAEDIEYGIWPPPVIVDAYAWWCEKVDSLLAHNPSWYAAMATFSPFVYFPFYMVAIYAFIKEKEWIRIPAIMWASAVLFSLIVITHEQLYGPYPTKNVTLFAVAYGGYIFMPLLVMLRVIRTPLFPNKDKSSDKTGGVTTNGTAPSKKKDKGKKKN